MSVKGPLHRELESITAQLRHFYMLSQQPLPGDITIVARQIQRLENILKGFDHEAATTTAPSTAHD